MVSVLEGKTYEDKLRELGLLTLEERRHQADMCMVLKIMHEESGLGPGIRFEKAETARGGRVTRSATEPLNIKVRAGHIEVTMNFFTMRVIEDWNRILAAVKTLQVGTNSKQLTKKCETTRSPPNGRQTWRTK
jgi:hypothetical protein